MLTLLIVAIIAALIFDFVNGWNDSANAIATVVGTRTLTPFYAIILATLCNFAGAFWSIKIAETVSKIVVVNADTANFMIHLSLSGLLAAIVWAAVMTKIGMPISGSHSLLGGLMGGALSAGGFNALHASPFLKFAIGLLVSPILGMIVGYLLFLSIAWLFRNKNLSTVTRIFTPLQIVSAAWVGFTHGTNDAQKVMGVIYMMLIAGGLIAKDSPMPFWVICSCATVISLGTLAGGWKVIKTLGSGLSDLKSPDGFAAEASTSAVLFGAAHFGIPVSTTHVITCAIMGVGATKPAGVRWKLGAKILLAWIMTLPATAIMAALIFTAIKYFVGV